MLTLNNGNEVPKIGYGCYNPDEGADKKKAILNAMEAGFRYFDTASLYETERPLADAIKESQIPRKDLFIATKVWHDEMGYTETKEAVYRSLDRLKCDYIDTYIIHWPKHVIEQPDYKEMDLDTWRAMEELQAEGVLINLGLSNFLPHHLKNILDNCTVKPQVDQLELHIGYMQEYALNALKANNILPQAWSPLARGTFFDNPIINSIAKELGLSMQELCLAFLINRGVMPIVKASSVERCKANLNCANITLDEEVISILSSVPPIAWLGEHPDFAPPYMKACNRNQ